MIITAQMIRDKLAFNGPMTFNDIVEALGVQKDEDQIKTVVAINNGVLVGAVKRKMIVCTKGKDVIYWTSWQDTANK